MRALLVLIVLARAAAADPPAAPTPVKISMQPKQPVVGPTLLGVAIAAGGALSSSQLHDEKFLVTSGELGGGAIGGGLATALLFALASPDNSDSDIGLSGAVVLAAVALPAGIAFGTWGAGELTDGSLHSGRALAGAFLGTFTGALVGATVAKLFGMKERTGTATMLGFTLSGATFGYQLLGGGPR